MRSDAARRAESYLRNLTVKQPGEVLLVLAQIGAQGVGGYQIDVRRLFPSFIAAWTHEKQHRFLSLILLQRLAFRDLHGLFLNEQARNTTAPFDVIAERVRVRVETVLCAGLEDETNVRMRKGLGQCCAGWAEQSAVRQRG
jgi:hypothetical protein